MATASLLVAGLVALLPSQATAAVASTITLQAPTQVDRGSLVDATGALTTDPDGAPVAGATLDWRADCLTDGFTPLATGQATTQPDGSFAVTYDPGRCTQARLTVTWDQAASPDLDRVSADTEVPWRLAQLTGVLPDQVFVGDDVDGSVTYIVDGEPVGGVTVSIVVSYGGGPVGGVDESGVTGADGVVRFRIPTYLATSYTVSAFASGTSDTTTASWSGGGTTQHVLTTLTLQALGYPFSAGGQVSLGGAVAREDTGSLAGLTVYVSEDDHDGQGWHGIGSTQTDSNGQFVLAEGLPHSGDVSFYAWVYGSPSDTPQGGRYTGASSEPVEITVRPQNTQVSLVPDRTTYVAGQSASIEVAVAGMQAGDPSRDLTVTAKPFGGLATVLYDGGVTTSSGVGLNQVMTTNETLHATVPADAAHTSGEALVDVHVREALRSSADRTVYAATRAPRLSAVNGSHRSGECVRFTVQKATARGWHTVTTSACRMTDAAGGAVWTSTARRSSGTRWRFRATFPGDELDLAAHSSWVGFRFRR